MSDSSCHGWYSLITEQLFITQISHFTEINQQL